MDPLINPFYPHINRVKLFPKSMCKSIESLIFERRSNSYLVKEKLIRGGALFLMPVCLQMAMYESMLASPYRTLNGEDADYFFVPVLDSCIITRADDAPHLSMEV